MEANILEHELVPKHEIMTKKVVDELLKQYGIKTENLPKIKDIDPVAKAIGAKKGQVLKITRDSMTSGEALYYRLVI